MFIMVDPATVKTESGVAPNERAGTRGGQRQSGQRYMPRDLRLVLAQKRRREKKSGEEDGPKEKSARLENEEGSGRSGGPGLTRQGKGDQNSGATIFNFYGATIFNFYNGSNPTFTYDIL